MAEIGLLLLAPSVLCSGIHVAMLAMAELCEADELYSMVENLSDEVQMLKKTVGSLTESKAALIRAFMRNHKALKMAEVQQRNSDEMLEHHEKAIASLEMTTRKDCATFATPFVNVLCG